MNRPDTRHPGTPQKNRSAPRRTPPWQAACLGFGLAAVIWFASSAYFLKKHQRAETQYNAGTITYNAGTITQNDFDTTIRNNARLAIGCKTLSGILCLATLTYLASQADMHRPAQATLGNEE